MDVSAITNLTSRLDNSGYTTTPVTDEDNTFKGILDSMMKGVSETNTLVNKASAEEIKFALGESDNTHDMLIAEQKALIALQYTVAVRDNMLTAYKEIMNMQI